MGQHSVFESTGSKAAIPRVVHILSGDLWAGAEVMAVNLLKGLNASGYCHLVVVLLNEGRVAQTLRSDGLKVFVIPESNTSFAHILLSFRKIIKDFCPDIIHSHRYKENVISYLASGRWITGNARPLLVSTQHGMPEGYGRKPSIKSRIISSINYFLLSRGFDQCVAVSEDLRANMIQHLGLRREKIPTIRNGIAIPESSATIGRKEFVVGSCGRFFSVKNFTLFVEIAAMLRSRLSEVRFVLAGDGPQREALSQLCRSHGLDGIFSMPGHVDDMASLYNGMDLFINTSLHEGIPMSVLEALGHGVPVLAPRVGGFPEIIDHGKDGFLIEGHDPGLFAGTCVEILTDRKLLFSMSSAARDKVKTKFSSARMADDYFHLYNGLSAEKNRRGNGAEVNS